jgi:hypothetical protein
MNPPTKKIALNARLRWPDVKDNYVVSYEGHDIGSVYKMGNRWAWSVTVPMALPDWTTGYAPDLHEGIKALGTAWTRVLSQTSPERLERAWEIEKSALARDAAVASANPNSGQ